MKREEFLLGLCVYALIFLAGFSRPVLQELRNSPWGEPVIHWARALWPPTAPRGVPVSPQTAEAVRARPSKRLILKETGKSPVSHAREVPWGGPAAPGAPTLLGSKPLPKQIPWVPDGKVHPAEEPTKG